MHQSDCFDVAMYERFAAGQLSDAEMDAVAEHVETCASCSQIIQEMPEDAFVAAMRAEGDRPAATWMGVAEPGFVDNLVRRVLSQPAQAAQATLDSAGQQSETTLLAGGESPWVAASSAAEAKELGDFLAPPQAPGELGYVGQYRVLQLLGAGGMGVVYLAEDLQLKRKVALKAMKPSVAVNASFRMRFLREAQMVAALTHDHVVAIHQVGEHRSVPFLVMPYLQGETLEDRLRREGRLAPAEVLRIGREIAEGLAAAHAQGLIHRDIKPSNIWLEGPAARVKILDFGLARDQEADNHISTTGVLLGTPAYMSPEQARTEMLDGRTDLFSLGCVMYRACTGQMPFAGPDVFAVLLAVTHEQPKPPAELDPSLPVELSALVMRLLEKDPARRVGSAAEVILALKQRAGEDTATLDLGTAARPAARAIPPRRRKWAMIAAGLAALAMAVTAAIVFYWQTNNGIVRIEIDDPGIEVTFGKDGPVFKGVDKHDIKVTPGQHGLHIKRGDLEFDTDKFILKRGETITLKIEWFKEGKLQVVQGDKVIGKKKLPKVDETVGPASGDYALSFENGYVLLPPSLKVDSSAPFTVEAYVTRKNTNAFNILFSPDHTTLNYMPQWQFRLYGEEKGAFLLRSDEAAVPGKKTHVAGVMTGKKLHLFVDGMLVRTNDTKGGMIGINKSHFKMGQGDALIDEVRVSKTARYDKDFTPQKRFEPDADTLALYHFDQGTGDVLKDSSGNGHHGKIVGARWVNADGSPIAAADPGKAFALRFEKGDSVNLGAQMHITDDSTSCTLEGWYLVEQPVTKESTNFYLLGGTNLGLGLAANGKFVFTPAARNITTGLIAKTKADVGTWTHIAGVTQGTENRFYVDGKLQVIKTGDKESQLKVLAKLAGRGVLMKEVRISKVARYDKDFTPQNRFEPDADTLALYHFDEGAGDVLKDSSANGHHGKIVGAKWVNADGSPIAIDYALAFDENCIVTLDSAFLDLSKPFTLEASVTFPDPKRARGYLFSSKEAGGGLRTTPGFSDWTFALRGNNGTRVEVKDSRKRVVAKKAHVAVVFDGKQFRLFVDGYLSQSESVPENFSIAKKLGLTLSNIGKPYHFHGIMDEVRISTVARYDKDFTPARRFEPDPDTLALYHFDEGTGDVLKDSSGNGHHGKIVGAKWVNADGTSIP